MPLPEAIRVRYTEEDAGYITTRPAVWQSSARLGSFPGVASVSVYNGVGVVKNFFKHTLTFASRERRPGRSDRFCRTVHRQTLDAADGSLPWRLDEAKLRPYPGFLCGV